MQTLQELYISRQLVSMSYFRGTKFKKAKSMQEVHHSRVKKARHKKGNTVISKSHSQGKKGSPSNIQGCKKVQSMTPRQFGQLSNRTHKNLLVSYPAFLKRKRTSQMVKTQSRHTLFSILYPRSASCNSLRFS